MPLTKNSNLNKKLINILKFLKPIFSLFSPPYQNWTDLCRLGALDKGL